MRYGLKLKLNREKMGLTQEEVADKIGISRKSLSNYENEITPIPLTVFIRLAELYQFDVFEILGVHDYGAGSKLEFDINPYYLIKAHARNLVASEMKSDILFGNDFPEEYYDRRFREKIKFLMEDPIYLLNIKDLSMQENLEDVKFFD